MKPYVAHSCFEDTHAAAILIIAHKVQEAKWLASQHSHLLDDCEYFDLRVRWLRDDSLLALADQDKLAQGIAHVVTDPATCESCKLWGCGVDAKGACCYCGEAAGETLVNLLKKETQDGN